MGWVVLAIIVIVVFIALSGRTQKPSSATAAALSTHAVFRVSPIFGTVCGVPRQPVDLPSYDEMEDDEREHAGHRPEYRGRVDDHERGASGPECSEHHARPAKALAEGQCPEHSQPEANET
jgi:hypothetical protein